MPTPLSTARRNLAWRIDKLLHGVAGAPEITAWQVDKVAAAIGALDDERFAEGETIMMKAEKAHLFAPAEYAAADRRDVPQLFEALKRAAGE